MVYSLLGILLLIFSSLVNSVTKKAGKISILAILASIISFYLYSNLYVDSALSLKTYVLVFVLGSVFKTIVDGEELRLKNITELFLPLVLISFDNSLISCIFLSTFLIVFDSKELNRQTGALLLFCSLIGLLSWVSLEISLLMTSLLLVLNLIFNLFWLKRDLSIERNFLYLVAIIISLPSEYSFYGFIILGSLYFFKLIGGIKNSNRRLLCLNSIALIGISALGFVTTPEVILIYFLTTLNWYGDSKLIEVHKEFNSSDLFAMVLGLMIFSTLYVGATVEAGLILFAPYVFLVFESKKRAVRGVFYLDELIACLVGLLILGNSIFLKFNFGGLGW